VKALPFASLTAAALIAAAPAAKAQTSVQVETQVSTRRAEVGRPFRIQLTAMVDAGAGVTPSRPELKVPRGLTAQGPSISTQRHVSIVGGRIEQRAGITATWTIIGSRPGRFSIGPASVMLGGQKHAGNSVTVEIVPTGSGTPPGGGRRRSPFGPFDPFDPFAPFPQLPQMPDFDLPLNDQDLLDNLPPVPEELKLDKALGNVAFLRATVTPNRAVVGEQVTLRVFAYGARGPFREGNTTDPSRPDFVSYPIIEDTYGQQPHRVPIEGEIWHALKIREVAMFPLHAGRLEIGPVRMDFDGRRYGSRGRPLTRESEPLQVVVTEPPVAGRPPGYRIGDVGRFTLTATVEPRKIQAGDAVSVIVTLKGKGHFPYDLRTPGQRGVEWLAPTVVDDIDVRATSVSGWRKFTYVVRIDEPGNVDLGEVALPYFDPWLRAYDTARTGLGSIAVSPNANAANTASNEPEDGLQELVHPRPTLGVGRVPPWQPADRPWFWALALSGPSLVLTARAGASATATLRARWRARRSAHETRIAGALRDASRAAAQGDAAGSANLSERAVLLAIERATGLRARAVLREELPARLAEAGLDEALVTQTHGLLETLDQIRFTGQPTESQATELVERARQVVQGLRRSPARRAPREEAV